MLIKPVWSDSLGAKSFCTRVETKDLKLVIDPGAAIMHPSFPASHEMKLYWLHEAVDAVKKACEKADALVITHYHFDHFIDFDAELYRGKKLFLKNPNEYINFSQRKRAEHFIQGLCSAFSGSDLSGFLQEKEVKNYPDPMKDLPSASSRDFKDYGTRREELLSKGAARFNKLASSWNKNPAILELSLDEVETIYPESREFVFGETKLRFTKPLFHGVEYASVGWVFSVVIESGGDKLLYSSDVCGPIIEDYADWIISEDPSMLIIDGPPTYLVPYMMNMINLKRAVDNLSRIISETSTQVIVLDHHLLRDNGYRKQLSGVYEKADRCGKKVCSVAEFLGKKPVLTPL